MTPDGYYNLLDALDDEIPYPQWMEEDIYRDRYEEDYNDMLARGGDL